MPTNGTMMQCFHWDYPAGGRLWQEVSANATDLSGAGFTALWLPSPCKALDGAQDVGYGIYDLFDLGEFDQKGSVATKYGTRAQLESAVRAARQAGLQIYLDTVLNHKGGADATEVTTGTPVSPDNRNIEIGSPREIEGWTQFAFPGRGTAHSSFQWHWYHFDAVDYDQRTGQRSIFRLRDKSFETPVDPERGNFDYLMFADLDMSRDDVRDECKAWGTWIAPDPGHRRLSPRRRAPHPLSLFRRVAGPCPGERRWPAPLRRGRVLYRQRRDLALVHRAPAMPSIPTGWRW